MMHRGAAHAYHRDEKAGLTREEHNQKGDSCFCFQIIRSYTLKDSDQKADSFFADLAVDVDKDSCNDAYAYLSDLGGYGLVVYSWAQNNSWRFHHNYFHFDPLNGKRIHFLYGHTIPRRGLFADFFIAFRCAKEMRV